MNVEKFTNLLFTFSRDGRGPGSPLCRLSPHASRRRTDLRHGSDFRNCLRCHPADPLPTQEILVTSQSHR